MASPKAGEISAAELEIKRRGRRRLIGAVTIGLLAIVFLPMIFDSEPQRNNRNKPSSQEISIQIPPKEGLPPLPAPSVASAPPASAPAAKPAPVEAATSTAPPAIVAPAEQRPTVAVIAKTDPAAAPIAAPAPRVPAKVDAVKPDKKPDPAPVAAPVVKPAETKQGFVVQVGAFKDAENAKQTITQAKVSKLPVYIDSVAIAGGTVTRVRVGPFATKQKADAALAQLKLSGSDGKIVPLP